MTTESTTEMLSPSEEAHRAITILKSVALREELESRLEDLRSRHSARGLHPNSKRARFRRPLLFIFCTIQIVAAISFVVWKVRSGEPEPWVIVMAGALGVQAYTQGLLEITRGAAERNEMRLLQALLDTRWREQAPSVPKSA